MNASEARSHELRSACLDLEHRRVLVARIGGSSQEADLQESPTCAGYGRIRHFTRETSEGWPANPLPIDPARAALGLSTADGIRALAFQNAACNWNCWYCFVPQELRTGSTSSAQWLTADSLVEMYMGLSDPPPMIDLTGGHPGLVPEWTLWMIRALVAAGLQRSVYLWTDDNLSNDFYWRHLSKNDRRLVAEYPSFGRVGCFKGFDADSFAFNTGATPTLFEGQFELFARYLAEGLDTYAYVTLTDPRGEQVEARVSRFVDRLQRVHELLPLRTVPLEIKSAYAPIVLSRIRERAMRTQWIAVDAWRQELSKRFPRQLLDAPVSGIVLKERE